MSREEIIYKYKPINEYTLDSLMNKYHYFSKPSQLNDPFYCRMQLDESFDKSSYDSLKPLVNEIADTWRILSLTEDCKNKKMWGLYADSYKGICIGYKSHPINNKKSLLLKQNKMLSKLNSAYDIESFYYEIIKINYVKEKFKFKSSVEDAKSAIRDSIYNKNKIWKYEAEYRCIISLNSEKEFSKEETSLELKMEYPDTEISHIIFGYNTDSYSQKLIKSIITSNYSNKIDFFIIEPNYQTETLERRILL